MYSLERMITLEKSTSPMIQEQRKEMKYFVLASNHAPQIYKGRYVPKQIKFEMKQIPTPELIEKLALEYIGDLPCILQEFQKSEYQDFSYPKEVAINV